MPITGTKMRIELEDKLRFRINLESEKRKISWLADQTIEEGGTDLGPTPVEMLVSSLGACVATMIVYYAQQKKIDISEMTVDITFEKEKNPYRVSKIDLKVHYPGKTDKKLQRIVERIAHTCIVHHTLTTPPEINLSFPWTEEEAG